MYPDIIFFSAPDFQRGMSQPPLHRQWRKGKQRASARKHHWLHCLWHLNDMKVLKSRVTTWRTALSPLLSVLVTEVVTFPLAVFIPDWLNLGWHRGGSSQYWVKEHVLTCMYRACSQDFERVRELHITPALQQWKGSVLPGSGSWRRLCRPARRAAHCTLQKG